MRFIQIKTLEGTFAVGGMLRRSEEEVELNKTIRLDRIVEVIENKDGTAYIRTEDGCYCTINNYRDIVEKLTKVETAETTKVGR